MDSEQLKLFLESKKEYLGKKVAIDSIMSAISFLTSSILATYEVVPGVLGKIMKVLFCLMGAYFCYRTGKDYMKYNREPYTYKELYKNIEKMDIIESHHSIVVIKDTYNKFSNRYLVYDDLRWNCLLFLNYKKVSDRKEEVEKSIKEHISRDLKINIADIEVKEVTSEIQRKHSEPDKVEKNYFHTYYSAEIKEFPEKLKADSFEIDGRKYYWMTINELEQDKEVIEKNSDVLGVVKVFF